MGSEVIIGARLGSERLRKDQTVQWPPQARNASPQLFASFDLMVRPARLERATSWFVASALPLTP